MIYFITILVLTVIFCELLIIKVAKETHRTTKAIVEMDQYYRQLQIDIKEKK